MKQLTTQQKLFVSEYMGKAWLEPMKFHAWIIIRAGN